MDADVSAALVRIPGVELSPSMFRSDGAFWCDGKEIAHADGPDVMDVRLTKAVIRQMRTTLRADPRVTLRGSGSDWIEVRYTSKDDLVFVLDLVERGAAMHRAEPGRLPKRPPIGTERDRRRRFH